MSELTRTISHMVDLLPGADVDHALQLLGAAVLGAANIMGRGSSGRDLLNAYRDWANQQARSLSTVLAPDAIDELVLTPGYGRLLQLDPAAYGNGLSSAVELELATATAALTRAREALVRRQQRWQDWRFSFAHGPLHVVVLDTNVLLRHADRLSQVDWRTPLQVFPDTPVALGIPLVVVKELDDLKMTTNKMEVDGVEVTTKSRVRIVHKLFDEWFRGSHTEAVLHQRTANDPAVGELTVKLAIDDLRHIRLPTADAEVIDRALALRPFSADIALATNDRAMRIQARFEGLKSFDPELLPSNAG